MAVATVVTSADGRHTDAGDFTVRLTFTALGWELDLTLGPTTPDDGSSLDGGTTTSERIDPGHTDWHLGFTNGREVGDDGD